MSLELHLYHCEFCYIPSKCQLQQQTADHSQKKQPCSWSHQESEQDGDNKPTLCPIVSCANSECSFLLHNCKLEDHLSICQYSIVPCINSHYGCRRVLPRFRMGPHLEHCEASVVMCCGTFARKLATRSEMEEGNYQRYFEKVIGATFDSNAEASGGEELFSGLLLEHWKDVLKTSNESEPEISSDVFVESCTVNREEGASSVDDSDVVGEENKDVSDDRVGKCVTCSKLGNTCMYDIERMNKKPFWVEARKHFSRDKTDGDVARGDERPALLMPELQNGCGYWFVQQERILWEMCFSRDKFPSREKEFSCRAMRRDEFASHWYLYHDVLLQFQPKRCPNSFGGYNNGDVCTYSVTLIDDSQYAVKYQLESRAVTFLPRQFTSEKCRQLNSQPNMDVTDVIESLPLLLKLPVEVVFGIFRYLDSLSLKCLSQVSQAIRWLVIDYCAEYGRAMAVTDWTKSSKLEQLTPGVSKWNMSPPRFQLSSECVNPQSVGRSSKELRERRAASEASYESQILSINSQLCSMIKTNFNASNSLTSHLAQCPCYERKSVEEIKKYNLDNLPEMTARTIGGFPIDRMDPDIHHH